MANKRQHRHGGIGNDSKQAKKRPLWQAPSKTSNSNALAAGAWRRRLCHQA